MKWLNTQEYPTHHCQIAILWVVFQLKIQGHYLTLLCFIETAAADIMILERVLHGVAMLEEICSMCCAPWFCGQKSLSPQKIFCHCGGPCAYCASLILALIFARLCTNGWKLYVLVELQSGESGFSCTPGYLLESVYKSSWWFFCLDNFC